MKKQPMKPLDRELLMIESAFLIDRYGMSYGQVANYINKTYGFFVHRQTIYRWLN